MAFANSFESLVCIGLRVAYEWQSRTISAGRIRKVFKD